MWFGTAPARPARRRPARSCRQCAEPSSVSPPDLTHEARLRACGHRLVAGIDEAGRGPLAGPVAAAAVILDPYDIPDGLDDSKRLPAAVRERVYAGIMSQARAVSVGFATAAEIDRLDIRQATFLAMVRAARGLALPPTIALIDGRDVPPGLACEAESLVAGDARSASIAAASIVAKVVRDRLMVSLARAFPAYGFERHKGYGTKAHLVAIEAHGPCPFHRLSFEPLRKSPIRNET
jgi:ribonuclease HII